MSGLYLVQWYSCTPKDSVAYTGIKTNKKVLSHNEVMVWSAWMPREVTDKWVGGEVRMGGRLRHQREQKVQKKSIAQSFLSDISAQSPTARQLCFFPRDHKEEEYLHILCLAQHQRILFIQNHLNFSQISSQTLKDIIGYKRSNRWIHQNHLYPIELTF